MYACCMHIHAPRSLGVIVVAAGVLAAGCGGGDRATTAAPSAARPAADARPAAEMVVVPRLVGRHQDEAHRVAARAGLQLRWTGFTGKLGNGRYNIGCVKVLRQSPVAGERRPRGSSIAVIEAACRTPREAPHGV
jgi:hypothetical protein